MLKIKSSGKTKAKVVFELGPGEGDHYVSVVGDFNGWDPYATPMKRRRDGTQRAKVKIPVGTDVPVQVPHRRRHLVLRSRHRDRGQRRRRAELGVAPSA